MNITEINACKNAAQYASAYYWGAAFAAAQKNDNHTLKACYQQACKWYNVSKREIGDFVKKGLDFPPERAILVGKQLPQEQVKSARIAVLNEIKRFGG